jgi:hypothetical protein
MRRQTAVLATLLLVSFLSGQVAAASIGVSGGGPKKAGPVDSTTDFSVCQCGTQTQQHHATANAQASVGSQAKGTDGNSVPVETDTYQRFTADISTEGQVQMHRTDRTGAAGIPFGKPYSSLAATESVELQVQKGIPDHSDSATVSIAFSFTANSSTHVSAELLNEPSSGKVTYSFVRWYSPTNGTSGTSSSWTAYPGEKYSVRYRVEATNGVREQVYTATARVGDNSQTFVNTKIRTNVEVLEPEFGSASDTSESVVLGPTDNRFSESISFSFSNSGDGTMRVDSVRANPRNANLDAQIVDHPDEVLSGNTGTVTLTISGNKDISEDTYQVEVTVDDAVGNSKSYTVQIEIRKPPAVGVTGTQVDVGNILRSETSSRTITFEELTGFDEVNGIVLYKARTPYNASIDLRDLSSAQISAGGSTDVQADFQVRGRANKHEQLTWQLNVKPDGEPDAEAQPVIIKARVVLKQHFSDIQANDVSFVFNRPRPANYAQSISGTVRNGGHFELDVTGASAAVTRSGISAEVIDSPNTIPRHSIDSYEVRIIAEDSVPEGEYPVEITFDAADAPSETITRLVTITHEREMSVSSKKIDFGEITLTNTDTRTVAVEEELGYQPIENLRVVRVSGPERGWLSINNPTSVDPGSSETVSFTVNFDDKAEVFSEYTWTLEISGEDVETKTVTVTAIYGFPEEEVINQLQNHKESDSSRSAIATPMIDVLQGLEGKARSDEISGGEVSIAFTSGKATDQFLDAMQRYEEVVEAEGNEAAQDELLEAAVAFNIFERYASQLSDQEFQTKSEQSLSQAKKVLDEAIDEQEAYYEGKLRNEDTSLLTAANIKRELARIALFRGNESRAKTLRKDANRTFNNYAENVSAGVERSQQADVFYQEMKSSMLVVVAGRPLLPNPMAYDAFAQQSTSIISQYEKAESNFRDAGASSQATEVQEDRNKVAADLRFARYSLYAFSVLYTVVFLFGLIRMGGNMIAYVRDVREAASGDFLV